ncbi:retinol dehydrogenase 11-like [Amphiura filiformis]|uniref:retinol dehydrogenase 11-like n=1 Tax=Amphiura filiformis TaxID=82378 RepID=UPI003B2192DE
MSLGSIILTCLGALLLLFVLYILFARYYFNGGFYRRYCDHITTTLHGKTAIITGGNAGIGKETAIDFARRGARVIIGCRNPKKATEAIKVIQRRSGSSNVVYIPLELSDQDSVREFAKTILKQESRIDYLINNAGIGKSTKGHRTKEGYNMVFAVNHFGHFLLTMLLLDRLKESAPSRIVNVSSINHTRVKEGDLYFTPKDAEGRIYPGLREYDRSKLANVLFTKELARQLEGSGVTTYSLHPGAIRTSIVDTIKETTQMSLSMYWFIIVFFWLMGSDERAGAQTTIYCALEESITHLSGCYFDNCHVAKGNKLADDNGLAKKLWDVSCQATGL